VRVLVTGGGGFIGSHLAERLLSDGHEVRVLDNFATGRRENLITFADDLELVEGDIQSYERVHTAVRGCDYVFHQAALPSVPRSVQDPLTSNASNVIGTLNVLLASRDCEVRRVIFASSSSIYGRNPELPKRETLATLPISPYAVAKLAGEGYCRSFSEVYGLDTVALRYFNVFGPRQDPLSQYAAVVPNFIVAALNGRPPVVHGDGEQTRDFTFIENVIAANVAAMNAIDVSGEALNIACGDRVSLNGLLDELGAVLGVTLSPEYTPPRPGDIRDSLADISKAQRLLGYSPSVDLAEGLARTAEWFQESGRAWTDALAPGATRTR
jgi:UDP-N-acetylglucosamine/UDP-N-acetyl-alpha-D-glucosaminouronate 4-epimerase